MIPPIVIRLLGSGILAFLVGRFVIKEKEKRKPIESTLLNGIWTYFLGVKLSLLFTHFESISIEPLLLLYGWGETANILFGIVVTVGYFAWFTLKKSTYKKQHALFTIVVSSIFFVLFFGSQPFFKYKSNQVSLSIKTFKTLKDLDENPVQLAQNQITILNFWATWCTPCRAEMPEIEAFNKEFPHVNFVTVNNIASEKKGLEGVKEFLATKEYSFTVVADVGNVLTHQFKISSFPTTLVFDKEGHLIDKHVGVISKGVLESFLVTD